MVTECHSRKSYELWPLFTFTNWGQFLIFASSTGLSSLFFSHQRGLKQFPAWRSASALYGDVVSTEYLWSCSVTPTQQSSVRIPCAPPITALLWSSYFTPGAIMFARNVYQTYACLWMYIPFRAWGSRYEIDVSRIGGHLCSFAYYAGKWSSGRPTNIDVNQH